MREWRGFVCAVYKEVKKERESVSFERFVAGLSAHRGKRLEERYFAARDIGEFVNVSCSGSRRNSPAAC